MNRQHLWPIGLLLAAGLSLPAAASAQDTIKVGGYSVYPLEIEAALEEHPDVVEAAVVGIPDARWGEVGLAVVVPQPGQVLSEADVLGFLAGKVARYKLPKSVSFAAELPRNAGGKLLKPMLRARYITAEPALAR